MTTADREAKTAESLNRLAQDLADYLNETVLDHDQVSGHDILEALASLGLTLVEDPVADSTFTYYESLPQPDEKQAPEDET